ncbi:MAG: DegT/DnrJ/EryC1/StrS family aminotransferase [Candidatus Omnitrophota bacterium]
MIPLLDLRKQYHTIKDEIDQRIAEILESGNFILGPEVKKLEEEMARFCQVKYAAGVASGTDALELALRALGVGRGDEVITTPFTFIATTEAITQVEAKVVFAEIDLDTYNINLEQIKKKITPRTKAIIPVHLYGLPCQIKEVIEIARRHKLYVIEDCAQAIGAEYQGQKVGSFGDVGCFSFFPSKNLGGYGDGGMVVTNNEKINEQVRMLRVHGSKNKYFHQVEGRNSRLDEIQAGILRIKLNHLNAWNEQRRKNARIYTEAFKAAGLTDKMAVPQEVEGSTHVFHLYVVRVPRRDQLLEFLKSQSIFAAIHYPVPLHLQEVYRGQGHKEGSFPISEKAAREIISLPFYPELTKEEILTVVQAIKEFYDK